MLTFEVFSTLASMLRHPYSYLALRKNPPPLSLLLPLVVVVPLLCPAAVLSSSALESRKTTTVAAAVADDVDAAMNLKSRVPEIRSGVRRSETEINTHEHYYNNNNKKCR